MVRCRIAILSAAVYPCNKLRNEPNLQIPPLSSEFKKLRNEPKTYFTQDQKIRSCFFSVPTVPMFDTEKANWISLRSVLPKANRR
jgi:hypothetical protein